MEKTNFFVNRDNLNRSKIQTILFNDLPEFCRPYLISINNHTSTLTRLNYVYDLRVFFKYLISEVFISYNIESTKNITIQMIDKIKADVINNFLIYLEYYYFQGTKHNTNTSLGKARKLSSIKSLFNYLLKNGLVSSNPATFVAVPKINSKDIIRLSGREINKLLDATEFANGLSPRQASYHKNTKCRDCAIISLLLGTGIRVSECVGLNLDDVDFSNSAFRITRKGGNTAQLYFNEDTGGFLYEYYQMRLSLNKQKIAKDATAFFLSLQNTRISIRAVEILVKKYSKIASPLKKITPHKLRSTFGTQLYRTTGDIYVVADVLGHKDVNTTKKHYAAISDDIRRKAIKKLNFTEDQNND